MIDSYFYNVHFFYHFFHLYIHPHNYIDLFFQLHWLTYMIYKYTVHGNLSNVLTNKKLMIEERYGLISNLT